MSLPPQGAWIEIALLSAGAWWIMSLPPQGAWIEIDYWATINSADEVAPPTGSVD